ncbi:hypothetical protein R1T08_02430 [Streptomyces sp. SBC-4]|nr:hypothetical protein [Streptomyces sp. SBC-4]MDV5143194.1 hypothetical protein [Streptomyces sp. SBC-4]
MSAVAAVAAMLPEFIVDAVVEAPVLPGQRTSLRSVPASGRTGDALDNPLRLGRGMRLRLRAAVLALLADPSIAGLKDAPKLAAVVLYAKSRAPEGRRDDLQSYTWGPELGRWLGMGESTVHHKVLPPLRDADALHTQVVTDHKGHPVGLDCLVMPLWRAHHGGGAGHPLALSKAELATLLRLIEALFGPGWDPEDKEPTPPGILAGRTGKGAATDRLGLLLMVLSTRASGWLQLCGGSVMKREGRGAATLARLLGCSPSGARKVLARLTEAGVVARGHRDTATRMRGRGRVMLLPIAHAYGRRGPGCLGAVQGPKSVFSARPDGAFSDLDTADDAAALGMPGTGGAGKAGEVSDQVRPDGAGLHADHTPVVTPVADLSLSGGFSGEGRGGQGRRPDRSCVREDQALDDETAVAGSGSPVAEVGPLRGEKPTESPVDEQEQAGAVAGGAGARLTVVGGRKTQLQGRPELPADLDLRVALTPVGWLWKDLNRWQQDRVVKAAKAELTQLRQLLEWQAQAPSLLAARLTSRLEETGGEALITSPLGWITHRGLVRRPSCTDLRCDDGTRLDTGADCDNCANVLHVRRAWRVRIAAEVDEELPGLDQDARYREIEARMRRHAEKETADLAARQAEAREREAQRAAARAEAEAQAAVERERAAAEAAARQVVACEDCGRARSAGLCEACDHRRQVEVLIGEAGLLAATWSADLTDPSSVEAVTAEVRAGIEDAIAAEWAEFQKITDPATLKAAGPEAVEDAAAHNAFLTAESATSEYRQQALVMLGRSGEAQTEARQAYATERAKPWHQALPDSDDALRTATEAAATAQVRTAEHLLAVRLEQLRTQARPEPVRPTPWSQRLPELAARPLNGETLEVIV